MDQYTSDQSDYWFNTHSVVIGLHADSIRKQIADQQILNDVFVSCKPGEIVGLLGRNGSGKSSLLKIIFGSLAADSQFVSIDNQKINSLYDNRKLLQYLPQESFLPNHIKITNIVSCFCNPENSALLVENSLVIPHLQKKSKQLSGGERRILEMYWIYPRGLF